MITIRRASIAPSRQHLSSLNCALAALLAISFASGASAGPAASGLSADQVRKFCGAAWSARGYRDGVAGLPARDHPFGGAAAAAAACHAAGAAAPDFSAYRAEYGAGRFLSGRRGNIQRALQGAPDGSPALQSRDKAIFNTPAPPPTGLLSRRGGTQDALRRRYDDADRRLNRRELSNSLSPAEQSIINRNRREIDRKRRLNEIFRPSPALR